MPPTPGAPTVKAWHLLTLATLLGFFSTTMAYQAVALFADKHQPFLLLFGINAPYWYAWALLVPFVLWLARRFPIARGTWRRSLLVHVPALLVVTFTRTMMTEFVVVQIVHAYWPEGATKMMGYWPRVRYNYVYQFDWEMVTYSAIVLFGHAVAYYREAQERSVSASQLEARLAEAQLQALQRQLHPHFLFNTLNAISALMHRDVEAADMMIARLSDLLRISLQMVGVQEISLKEELDFLSKYLEIEQTRFRDRLTVVFDVQPEALDALVPNLILQPLVENAIKHGIGPRPSPGTITIKARLAGSERLELIVQDNGVGMSAARLSDFNRGVGLSNTRARLEHLYGSLHRFEFRQPPEGGLQVLIVVPLEAVAEEVIGVRVVEGAA